MLPLRANALITGGLFVAMLLLAATGNLVRDQGLLADTPTLRLDAMLVFFGLFLLFGFSAIPLMVRLVLAVQVRLGNANRPVIRRAIAHERLIVLAMWSVITAGIAIALPAAIKDGLFDDPAAEIAATPSRGTLVARPGMAVVEIARRSTLPLNIGQAVIADGTIFNFEIADTAISFPRCRYYFMTYARGDNSRVDMMSIGTASRSLARAEVEQADQTLRDRLAADGWLSGHEVYRTEQDRRLHDGATEGPRGNHWLKGDTVLTIQRRRMDEAKPGEPPDSGAWIQFLDLGLYDRWSSRDRFMFAPPGR